MKKEKEKKKRFFKDIARFDHVNFSINLKLHTIRYGTILSSVFFLVKILSSVDMIELQQMWAVAYQDLVNKQFLTKSKEKGHVTYLFVSKLCLPIKKTFDMFIKKKKTFDINHKQWSIPFNYYIFRWNNQETKFGLYSN